MRAILAPAGTETITGRMDSALAFAGEHGRSVQAFALSPDEYSQFARECLALGLPATPATYRGVPVQREI